MQGNPDGATNTARIKCTGFVLLEQRGLPDKHLSNVLFNVLKLR